ncbi:MAG: DNA polymerase III subunit gamma/tau [Solirubrobacterales bacterium]
MAEQSLYRRHRPGSFDQVVGQEHVVRTLRNAIERDRIHHAYLFVGSRGTGKTSMAKILARSLNCVNGPTATPCGECDPCREIAAGNSFDVIEMDAASNRSVDDIRELRERVSYAPTAGGWKVYILDEAHMLTREAWNAFLKTLEEPPPNTVFVLATTEAHKVMPTIVDRCQRFDFARPSLEHLVEVLRRTAGAEGIEIADDAIAAIARAANGSFRDALGTLDQLVAYSGTEIATEDVLAVLGVADAELLYAATDAIASSDGRAALAVAAGVAGSGRDPARFATDLISHLRQLLVVSTVGEIPDHLFVADEHAARLSQQAGACDDAALVRAIDLLAGAVAEIREGDEARMAVELALLRAAKPEIDPSRAALAQRLERLERGSAAVGAEASPPGDAPAASPPSEPAPAPTADSAPSRVPTSAPEPSGADAPQAAPPEAPSTPAPAPAPGPEPRRPTPTQAPTQDLDLSSLRAAWPAVIASLTDTGATFLAAAFEGATPTALGPEGEVEIAFPPSAAFNKRKAEGKEERDRLVAAMRAALGRALVPSFVIAEAEPGPPVEADDAAAPVDETELVERFKTEFDAEELIDDPKEDVS